MQENVNDILVEMSMVREINQNFDTSVFTLVTFLFLICGPVKLANTFSACSLRKVLQNTDKKQQRLPFTV